MDRNALTRWSVFLFVVIAFAIDGSNAAPVLTKMRNCLNKLLNLGDYSKEAAKEVSHILKINESCDLQLVTGVSSGDFSFRIVIAFARFLFNNILFFKIAKRHTAGGVLADLPENW